MGQSQKKLKLYPAICKAIRKKAVIQFDYDGTARIVEPQAHGISLAGNEVIRCVQKSPSGPSGKSIEGKLYSASKISDLKNTGQSFLKPGAHFNPDDKAMIYVHCHLEEGKARNRRKAMTKKATLK